MNSVPPSASSSAPGLRSSAPLAAVDAEQFDFHAFWRNRGGVDHDEGTARAAGRLVDRARRQFLARARGADDEDAAVGRRHSFDGLAQLRDGGGAADQRGRLRRHLLELLDLAFEPRCFECALGHQHQPVGLERFFDEIIGAVFDGSDRGFDVAMAGDHHQRHLGMFLLDGIEQLQAVELAALQPNVEENQVRLARRRWRPARHRCCARCARRSPRPAGCRPPDRGCRPRHRQ